MYNLKEGLISRGIDETKVENITTNLEETIRLLTRRNFGHYYAAIGDIIYAGESVSPKNKFRAILTKFADCITNTEVPEEEIIFTNDDIVAALVSGDEETIKRFIKKRKKKGFVGQHKEIRKKEYMPGNQRIYRTYKNYFLINIYKTYQKQMEVGSAFSALGSRGVLGAIMQTDGFLDDMVKLTEHYLQFKNTEGDAGHYFRALETLSRHADEFKEATGISTAKGRANFVLKCLNSSFFKYMCSFDDLVSDLDRYQAEQKEFTRNKGKIREYQRMLRLRNVECAIQVQDHLINYHCLDSPNALLNFGKVRKFNVTNDNYDEAGGYGFITKPTEAEVLLPDDEANGGMKILFKNGRMKTLETPDGIILYFIDTKVRGDENILTDLYRNKGNMYWAALVSRTLGEKKYKKEDFVLVGLDPRGLHPTQL